MFSWKVLKRSVSVTGRPVSLPLVVLNLSYTMQPHLKQEAVLLRCQVPHMAYPRNGGLTKLDNIIMLIKQKETKDLCDIWSWWVGYVERQPCCPQIRPPRYLTLVFGVQSLMLWAVFLLFSKCVGRSLSSSLNMRQQSNLQITSKSSNAKKKKKEFAES
jgi:hypothetical protein